MPSKLTPIKEIIANYSNVWKRLTRSKVTRAEQAWRAILGLSVDEVKAASDEDINKLNDIISQIKYVDKKASSSAFLEYARQILMDEDVMHRLDIDPRFVFDNISTHDKEREFYKIRALCCLKHEDWRLDPSLVETLLCEKGNIDKVANFYEFIKPGEGIALTPALEKLLCSETDSYYGLRALVQKCIIQNPERNQACFQPDSDQIADEIRSNLEMWIKLKQLPYETDKQREKVLGFARQYAFDLLSTRHWDKKFLYDLLDKHKDELPEISREELCEDYKQFLINYLNEHDTAYLLRSKDKYPLGYLCDEDSSKISETMGYELLTNNPDLAQKFLQISPAEKRVFLGLSLFSPLLMKGKDDRVAQIVKAPKRETDLLRILLVDHLHHNALNQWIKYYNEHPEQDPALLTLLTVIFNDDETKEMLTYYGAGLDMSYHILLSYAHRNPEKIDEVLKLNQKFEDFQKKQLGRLADNNESFAFYAGLLANLPKNSDKRKEIEQKLCELAEVKWPPKEKYTVEGRISRFPPLDTMSEEQQKQMEKWVVSHGLVSLENAFWYRQDDPKVDDNALQCFRYAVQLLKTGEGLKDCGSKTPWHCMDSVVYYLKNHEPSLDPKDELSIQSLLSCLSQLNPYLNTFNKVDSELVTKLHVVILEKAHEMAKQDPSLLPLIQSAVMDLQCKSKFDYNLLWPVIKDDIPVDKRYEELSDISFRHLWEFPVLVPEITKWADKGEGLTKNQARDLFSDAIERLWEQDIPDQKKVIGSIPWAKYYTADELLNRYIDAEVSDLSELRVQTLLDGAILTQFPDNNDLKKKVLAHLDPLLGRTPNDEPFGDPLLASLVPVVKSLTIGKICSQEELEALSPAMRTAYKLMRYDEQALDYLEKTYSLDQLLAMDDLYHRIFSNIVRYQKKALMENDQYVGAEQINKHHIAELADRVRGIMGKDYAAFFDTVSRLGDIEEYCGIFSPDGDSWSESDKQALKDFLSHYMVYAADGKKHLRPAPELRMICSSWPKMVEADDRSGRYQHILSMARAHTYDNVKCKDLAAEAYLCGVSPEKYQDVEHLFVTAQGVPEPFNTKIRFVAENEEQGRLIGRFLSRSDPRALSFGFYTGCCQHWRGAGHDCAVSSMMDPFSQVFAVENSRGELVAGSWVWRTSEDQNFGVCFDNVEAKGGYKFSPLLNQIYDQAAAYLCDNGVRKVTLGAGNNDINVEPYKKSEELLVPNYGAYGDAKDEQYVMLASDKKSDLPDKRLPFFIRSVVCTDHAKASDHRDPTGAKDFMPSLRADDANVLIDKNGSFQGACHIFRNGEAGFAINPEFAQQNPKALLRLWRSFQSMVAQYPKRTSWTLTYPENNGPILELLKKKGKVSFDKLTGHEGTVVQVPLPKNMDKRLMKTVEQTATQHAKRTKVQSEGAKQH